MIVRRALGALMALSVLAACSDDDDATDSTTSDAPAASGSMPTTDDPAITEATTTTTSTTPPPTTSPEEALKAQIAADYLTASDRYFELVNQPSLDSLAERAKLAAADGSDYYAAVVAEVEELVAVGDRVVPNDPDIRRVDVEAVELVGTAPHREAFVTVCLVTNAKRITPPENSPVGEEIVTLGTGELVSYRHREHVLLTENGWLPTQAVVDATGVWEGSDQCEPA